MRRPPPTYKDRSTLDVKGMTRTYWVAPDLSTTPGADASVDRPRPLLLAFHGLTSSGSRMAWWTGLGPRGPQAGFLSVFPDALDTMWDDHGRGRRDGADDIAFVAALIDDLVRTKGADPDRVFLTGISTGATFLERVARSGAARVNGIALITGTARVASTAGTPISARSTPVLIMAGTADPMTPYAGGLPRGPMGRAELRTVRKTLLDPSGHESVAPEALAAEWATINNCAPVPLVEAVPRAPGTLAVERLTWVPARPESRPVVLYRIEGGGHGWPGGKQYLPPRLIGRIPQHLDGTAIVLDFARAAGAAEGASQPSSTYR
jgi:polyhydroxybutyrate depolymerase